MIYAPSAPSDLIHTCCWKHLFLCQRYPASYLRAFWIVFGIFINWSFLYLISSASVYLWERLQYIYNEPNRMKYCSCYFCCFIGIDTFWCFHGHDGRICILHKGICRRVLLAFLLQKFLIIGWNKKPIVTFRPTKRFCLWHNLA